MGMIGEDQSTKLRGLWDPADRWARPTVGPRPTEDRVARADSEVQLHKASNPYVPPIPFPSRMKKEKQAPKFVGHLQSKPKRSDPGSFELEVILDNGENVSGLIDLGVAVNLMPHSIFEKLSSKNLKPTDIRIELADGTLSHPLGIIEDVAILVSGMRVINDFVVFDVGRGARSENGHLLLLGRPFMATTETRIDCRLRHFEHGW